METFRVILGLLWFAFGAVMGILALGAVLEGSFFFVPFGVVAFFSAKISYKMLFR